MLRKILNVFITKKSNQCKTSCTLKIDVYEIPNNKHIRNCFSKYELLFQDQANSSSDRSKILILQSSIPTTFLLPLPFLFNFAPAYWNLSSTQSPSCSSSASLFFPSPFNYMPPQVLDIPNHMTSQTNQIYYQATSRSK